MRRWQLIIILLVCMIPSISAYTQVQYSLDNVTWEDAINVSENETTLEVLNNGIDADTDYYFRLRQIWATGNSSWVYTSGKTEAGGLDEMSLAIVIGLGIIAFFFAYVSFKLEEDHFLLKLLFLIVGLVTLIVIPSALLTGGDTLPISSLKMVLWAYRLAMIYFLGYIFWHWVKTTGTFAKMFPRASRGINKNGP